MSLAVTGVKPILKWPGGKQWLAPVLAAVLRDQRFSTYIEPFAGAAALFFRLAPERAVLSDLNPALVNCLQAVQESPGRVISHLTRFENTRSCYDRVRASTPRGRFSNAARLIYLTRTAWGGIYRENKSGRFNVPFGNSGRTHFDADAIQQAALRLRTASIRCCDFRETLRTVRSGALLYLDPPYALPEYDVPFARYTRSTFGWAEQLDLAVRAARAAKHAAQVVVSGPWDPRFLALYSGWFTLPVERFSSVTKQSSKRRHIREALLFSKPLNGARSNELKNIRLGLQRTAIADCIHVHE